MRAAFLTFLLLLPAASAGGAPPARAPAAGEPLCRPSRFDPRPARERGPVRLKRLGEEAPADMLLAVVQRRGGCIEPVVVRENVGGLAR